MTEISETSNESILARLRNVESELHRLSNVLQDVTSHGATLAPHHLAALEEAASFFRTHSVVANTVATKESDYGGEIDPNTGLPVVVIERPDIRMGRGGSFQIEPTAPGA